MRPAPTPLDSSASADLARAVKTELDRMSLPADQVGHGFRLGVRHADLVIQVDCRSSFDGASGRISFEDRDGTDRAFFLPEGITAVAVAEILAAVTRVTAVREQ
jgi:hypothetical protein